MLSQTYKPLIKSNVKYLAILVLLGIFYVNSLNAAIGEEFESFNDRFNVSNPANLVYVTDFEISIFPFAHGEFNMVLPYTPARMFSKSKNSDGYSLDITKISNTLGNRRSLFFSSKVNLFYFASNFEKNYFKIYVQDEIVGGIGFNRSFMQLLNKGNKSYLGKDATFGLPITELHYRSYNFNWANTITEKIALGFTGKILYGKSMFQSKPTFSVYTQNDIDYIDINVSGKAQSALPINFQANETGYSDSIKSDFRIGKYLLRMQNVGWGVDVGANYKYTEQIKVYAGFNNLGFIAWTDYQDLDIEGTYRWSGVDISNLISSAKNSEVFESFTNFGFRDSFLTQSVRPVNKTKLKALPLEIYFGGNYQYSRSLKFDVSNRTLFYNHFVRDYLDIMANYQFNNRWSLNGGWSITNRSYLNLPVGFVFRTEKLKIQFHLNNLTSVVIPSWSKTFGGSFSMTYRFDLFTNAQRDMMKTYPFYKVWQRNKNQKKIANLIQKITEM